MPKKAGDDPGSQKKKNRNELSGGGKNTINNG